MKKVFDRLINLGAEEGDVAENATTFERFNALLSAEAIDGQDISEANESGSQQGDKDGAASDSASERGSGSASEKRSTRSGRRDVQSESSEGEEISSSATRRVSAGRGGKLLVEAAEQQSSKGERAREKKDRPTKKVSSKSDSGELRRLLLEAAARKKLQKRDPLEAIRSVLLESSDEGDGGLEKVVPQKRSLSEISSSDDGDQESMATNDHGAKKKRKERDLAILVEKPKGERTVRLQRTEQDRESKNLFRGYMSVAHNVSSYVTGTNRCRAVRNQREAETLARIVDLLVSQFGTKVVTAVDAVEVALRRMAAIYLADQQESWSMASHLEENPTGLPISSKMMSEARKASKLLNPRLTVTMPTERRARDLERGRGDDRGATGGYSRREGDRPYERDRDRFSGRSRDASRDRYRDRDSGRSSRGPRPKSRN